MSGADATARDTRMCGFSFAELLREVYPTHTAKRAAAAADASHRTSEAWVSGRREPSISVFLRMANRCDRMADALQRVLDARQAADARNTRAQVNRTQPAEQGMKGEKG